MSFVRINRRPVRHKKASFPKKEWVSTVHDLSVHKPTTEELSRRHDMHRSRNKAAAQWELREKTLKKRKPRPASPPGLDQTRLRLFREVFSDHCDLQDVLARSDRALAVVKDLFGEKPRRQKGFPSVTVAPDCESDSEFPVLQKLDPPTQPLLRQAAMDRRPLNDMKNSTAEPQEDLQDVSGSVHSEMYRTRRKTCKGKAFVWRPTPESEQQNIPQTPYNVPSSENHAALNSTPAVQHLKLRQSKSKADQSTTSVTHVLNPDTSPSCSVFSAVKSKSFGTTRGKSLESAPSTNQSSLELLQDMLGQVETELGCLAPQEPFLKQPESHHGRSLTGFSVALVSTLGRIVYHLKRRDEEFLKEVQVRRRMEEEMKEQRSLIDALTAECLTLGEEIATIQASLQKRVAELEQRLDMVILAMGELGKYGDIQGDLEKTAAGQLPPITAERDEENPAPVSPAVLLSPPHQRDNRAPPTAQARSLHFEGSQTIASESLGGSEGACTPSSFASLPEKILPHPAQLLHQLSQDAVLEEIEELTRQNAVIWAQLEHNKVSPKQHSDRCASPPARPHSTLECVGVDGSSVRLMEDRLQELNRQSAAARAKLLELIEQKKPATSQCSSSSISPIPPRSSSSHTVFGRQTPELHVSVPERALSSHARPNRWSAEAISPQNTDG